MDADANWTDCWTGYEAKHADGQQLADGQHTVQIRAKADHSTTYTHTWTLDTTAPDAPVITSAPDASSTQTTATFEFTSEPGATFVCDLDRNPEKQYIDSCESPQTYTNLSVGAHTFMVAAIDAAGNAGPAREYTFTVTAAQPTTATTTPPLTTTTEPDQADAGGSQQGQAQLAHPDQEAPGQGLLHHQQAEHRHADAHPEGQGQDQDGRQGLLQGQGRQGQLHAEHQGRQAQPPARAPTR